MKSLLIAIALILGGCGVGNFHEVRPDGTTIDVYGSHLFSNPIFGNVKAATTQATIEVDGFKSESQINLADLLKAASLLAPKP